MLQAGQCKIDQRQTVFIAHCRLKTGQPQGDRRHTVIGVLHQIIDLLLLYLCIFGQQQKINHGARAEGIAGRFNQFVWQCTEHLPREFQMLLLWLTDAVNRILRRQYARDGEQGFLVECRLSLTRLLPGLLP